MRRPALYSSSRSQRSADAAAPDSGPQPVQAAQASPAGKPSRFSTSSPKLLWMAILVLAGLLVVSLSLSLRPGQRRLTQEDINAAVMKTMETQVMPSEYAKAYDNIRPSVVRV